MHLQSCCLLIFKEIFHQQFNWNIHVSQSGTVSLTCDSLVILVSTVFVLDVALFRMIFYYVKLQKFRIINDEVTVTAFV